VLHFIADLEGIFGEAARLVRSGGEFAFTTKAASTLAHDQQKYERQRNGEFEIFAHTPAYIEALSAQSAFTRLKTQRCFVGADLFDLWVTRKN
jgi:predicted TPR repeat methyltransferase